MNSKTNLPGEIVVYDRQFSWRTAWNVMAWFFTAFVISIVCDMIFPATIRQWPLSGRLAVVLAEFVPIALWARNMARWIRGMDELHRRIVLATLLFAVSATFFVMLLWLRLDAAKFFNAVLGPPRMNGTWGIYSVAHAYTLMSFFYGIGWLVFNRRYK